jgi:O-antigen ligase
MDIRGHTRRARALTILVALALAAIAYFSVRHQLDQNQVQRQNGSIGVRFNVEKETRRIWHTSPAYGVGLKYFNAGNYGPFAVAANNAVDNELAESGVVGLVGFVLLQGAMFVTSAKRRRNDKFVAAGVGVVFGQLMHGMVDIYWTAGVVSVSFVLLGMALARAPSRPSARAEDDPIGPLEDAVPAIAVDRRFGPDAER